MTHTGPMPESAGEFTATELDARTCRRCQKSTAHKAEKWESSDGAYEDWKYTCQLCGQVHWVDGCDS